MSINHQTQSQLAIPTRFSTNVNCPSIGNASERTASKAFIVLFQELLAKNNIKIENERIKTYKRNLVASDSLVDFNGVLLPEGTAYDPQSNIYEYDYYAQLGSNQIVLNTQLANIIALRDSQGKFDI